MTRRPQTGHWYLPISEPPWRFAERITCHTAIFSRSGASLRASFSADLAIPSCRLFSKALSSTYSRYGLINHLGLPLQVRAYGADPLAVPTTAPFGSFLDIKNEHVVNIVDHL